MEPLESGQIQPLGLSHAIGPPGWRPYFQRGIPSILKRLEHPKPHHRSLWWTFPLAPPLAQGPTAGRFQGPRHLQAGVQGATRPISVLKGFGGLPVLPGPPGPSWAPLGPPGPPWPPLAPAGPAGPLAGSPLAPLAAPGPPWPPLPSLPFSADFLRRLQPCV